MKNLYFQGGYASLTAVIVTIFGNSGGILSEGNFDDVSFNDDGDYPKLPESSGTDNLIPEKRGVLLTKEGLRKVITQFEKKLDTPFFYPPLDNRITYKKIFFEQVKHFRRVLTGEESSYQPFQIK